MQHVKTRDIEGEVDRPPANGPAAWMDEVRTTLALAWPLILTNLAQTGMTTTDVVMMGRLGPERAGRGFARLQCAISPSSSSASA